MAPETTRKLLLLGAGVLLVGAGALYVNHLIHRGDDALRRAEAAELREKGALVQAEADRKEFELEVKALMRGSSEIADELAKVKGAKPKVIEKLVTQTVEIPRVVTVEGKPQPCFLTEGDRVRFLVDRLELGTAEGNTVVAGQVALYRVVGETGPDVELFHAPFKSALSTSKTLVPPTLREPNWGVGGWVVGGKSGWGIGPLVGFPTAAIGALHLDSFAGLALGSGGEWFGSAGAIVRW